VSIVSTLEELSISENLVIAVVPTYRPDIYLIDRLDALAVQVHAVIVVDDGSPLHMRQPLEAAEIEGYEIVESDANRGIGSAINIGVQLALDRGATHVLTLDQDTVLPIDYVQRCLGVFELQEPEVRIGVVCAESVNEAPTIPERRTASGIGLLPVAIQSGFLVSAECFRECGLFDDRLFIDMVDTEYCLRLRRFGFWVAAAPGTDIEHSLGELQPIKPFGIQRIRDDEKQYYEYHGPTRWYYIVRNAVDMYLRYIRRRPRWVASSVRQLGTAFALTLGSGPHRTKQLIAAVVGVGHGLIRRRGPLTPGLRRRLTPRRHVPGPPN
jgi:rhamnosyltransferase